MQKYVVITIDVEPDCTPNWIYSDPLTFRGVSEGIKERLQPLFNKYDVTPTYLINNVVLENQESVEIFKKLSGSFELGTHLHPEFIDPKKKYQEYAGKKGIANCCFYDPETEFQKIENITRLFETQFGYSPTSFRAGRFSAGSNTIRSLQKLNYKVDTSVTPNVRWDDKTRENPVDFRYAPNQPYWLSKEAITVSSKSKDILEAPVSIVRKRLSPYHYLKHIVTNKRLPFKGSKALWLRPVFSGMEDFKMILNVLETANHEKGIVVYNMMFHNVEVMPALSPYSLTEVDCRNYLALLEKFLQYTTKNKIDSIALSGLYEIFRGQ